MVVERDSLIWQSIARYENQYSADYIPYKVNRKLEFSNVIYNEKIKRMGFYVCYIDGIEHYFITFSKRCYGKFHAHVKISDIFRVTKDEGNRIYLQVKRTQFISKGGSLCYRFGKPAQKHWNDVEIIDF